MRRKYFKTKAQANKACDEIDPTRVRVQVYKMPKGSRHAGEFAVCSFLEYLNTY